MPPTRPINDLVNIAKQLGGMDTSSLSRGIQAPRLKRSTTQQSNSSSSDTHLRSGQHTRIRTTAILNKVITLVESQIVKTITDAHTPIEKLEARLTLSFLASQRKLLLKYCDEIPEDACLLDSLIEFTSFIENSITLLQSNHQDRFLPIVNYLREKHSTLVLYGVCQPTIKKELKTIKAQVQDTHTHPNKDSLIQQLYDCYEKLEHLISLATPNTQKSLLDELTFIS